MYVYRGNSFKFQKKKFSNRMQTKMDEDRPQESLSRSTRVLQQLVNGIANGVPASYETLVRFAIEGVPYLTSEVSVKERSRKLLEEYENDVESVLKRLEEETRRGWGFVMGKTLLQIVGGT